MNKNISITVMMPSLNEEKNIEESATELMDIFRDTGYDWEIVMVDDGSTDATGRIIYELAKNEPRMKIIHHQRSQGIGYCFREGVHESSKDVITWLPADGENDPRELLKYLPLIEHVDIVIPFVVNKRIRPLGRRILSSIYLSIINCTFRTRFNYTNGNIIYRKDVFEVVRPRSNGFLVHAECLVRAIHSGFIFAEVPVVLQKRSAGTSKAILTKAFLQVIREFVLLFFSFYIQREGSAERRRISRR